MPPERVKDASVSSVGGSTRVPEVTEARVPEVAEARVPEVVETRVPEVAETRGETTQVLRGVGHVTSRAPLSGLNGSSISYCDVRDVRPWDGRRCLCR